MHRLHPKKHCYDNECRYKNGCQCEGEYSLQLHERRGKSIP